VSHEHDSEQTSIPLSPDHLSDRPQPSVEARQNLTEGAQRAQDRVLALSRAVAGVQALLDPDRVLRAVGDELRAQGLNCLFALLDDRRQQIVVRHPNAKPETVRAAEAIPDTPAERFTLSPDVSASVVETLRKAKTTLQNDPSHAINEIMPDLPEEVARRLDELLGGHPFISTPLLAGSEILGFLTVWSEHLTEADVPTVSVLAQQAAVALERAKLYEEAMQRVFEMQALRETTLDITRQLDLPHLLRQIVERAAALTRTQGGSLYLYRPDRHELELVVGHNLGQDYAGLSLEAGEGLSGRVFSTGEPLAVDDYSNWDHRSSKFDDARFGRVVAVPLKWAEKIIGVLALTDGMGPRSFKERDLWLLEWFADHAAVAIENARLFAEREHKIDQLAALYEVSLEILAETDPSQLLLTVVQKASVLLEAEAGAIDLFDPETQSLEMKYSHGYHKDYTAVRLSPGEGVAGTVCKTRQPLAIDDYATWSGRVPQVDKTEISAALGVPLLRGDTLLGALTIDRRTPRPFDDEDTQLATLFANQAAIAIENSRLFEEAKERAEELEGLYQLSTEVAAQLDLPTLLDTIVERAIDLLGARAGGLYLLDADRELLELTVGRGQEHDHRGTILALGEGACGRVAQTGEPLRVEDYASWEGRSPYFADEPTCNVLAVPIERGNDLLGAFFVDDSNLERVFDETDLRLANLFANQAAIAIQNARLFAAREQTIRQLSALHDVSLQVVSTTDLSEVLPTIVRVAAQLLDAPSGAIDLFDAEREDLELTTVHGHGQHLIGLRHVLGEGVVGQVALTKKPLLVDDCPAWPDHSPQWEGEPIKAVLGVPLLRGDQLLGVLTLDRSSAPTFKESDLKLAALFAHQAAIAIQNANTVAATARRVTELTALREISLQLTQSLDLATVLDTIVDSAVTLVRASDAHIFLCDDDGEQFAFGSGAWAPGHERRPFTEVRDNGLTATVARSGEPVVINDARTHPLFGNGLDEDKTMDAIAGFPLKRADRVLGVFNVAFLEPHTFDQDELRVLTLLADQAAIAVENARLYEETQRRLKETQTLQDISRLVNSSLEPAQILQTVVERLASAFGYQWVSIYTMDENGLRLGAQVGYNPRDAIDFVPLSEGIMGRAARTAEEEYLSDVTTDSEFLSAAQGVVSEIAVPIKKDHEVLGVLNVESTAASPLTEADLNLVRSLAHQVSVAIQNAQLYQAVHRELAERKRAEESYRAVVDHSLQGLLVLQDRQIVFANQALAEIVGYTTEELLSLTPSEVSQFLLHPEDRDLVWGRFRQRLEGKAVPPHYEYRVIRKDGSVLWVEMYANLMEYQGRPAIQAAIVDISERKQAEEALRESEERYRSLFEDSRDAVCITTRQGAIVDVNESFLTMFDVNRKDLAQITMADLYTLPTAISGFQTEIEEKSSVRDYEVKLRKTDGTPIDALISATLWRDTDGRVLGYRGIIRDVTEQKRAQEELRQSYLTLTSALKGTVDALAALAEIRDPYTAGHQQRVARLASTIALDMGLSHDLVDGIRMAGVVHDIGKIDVPAEILSKPTQLTDIEWQMIKMHPQTAYDILRTVNFPWPVAKIVLQHHERMDGSGYPNGLSRDGILLEARILAVADVVEAMASDRPYRPAHGIDEALAEIEAHAGTLYDGQVVQVCLKLFRQKRYDLQDVDAPLPWSNDRL
jgi:PAS domain S-box-containing protein